MHLPDAVPICAPYHCTVISMMHSTLLCAVMCTASCKTTYSQQYCRRACRPCVCMCVCVCSSSNSTLDGSASASSWERAKTAPYYVQCGQQRPGMCGGAFAHLPRSGGSGQKASWWFGKVSTRKAYRGGKCARIRPGSRAAE